MGWRSRSRCVMDMCLVELRLGTGGAPRCCRGASSTERHSAGTELPLPRQRTTNRGVSRVRFLAAFHQRHGALAQSASLLHPETLPFLNS